MKREPHIHTPAHDEPPHVLFPLMTQPCKPVEKENEANYMRGLLERTIAMLKGPTNG